jgi:hypothetical protein
VRDVLATQIDLRKDGIEYVSLSELPRGHRYFALQEALGTAAAPSEQAIGEERRARGNEYRDQTDGDHPVADLRGPASTR